MVFIPSGVVHSIENASEEILIYVSAATPTADWRVFYDEGPLGPRSREKEGA
jgi:mannose-6-phosphate isomerase-like protein (cupin superfamily)